MGPAGLNIPVIVIRQVRKLRKLRPETVFQLIIIVNGYGFKEASCINQLKKSVTPTIFIHVEEDLFVPYRMMDLNYNAAACEKEKLSIPDAEHAEAHLVHPDLYWSNTFRFIDKYVK